MSVAYARGALWAMGDRLDPLTTRRSLRLAHRCQVYHSLLGDDNTGFSCFEILGFDIILDKKVGPLRDCYIIVTHARQGRWA